MRPCFPNRTDLRKKGDPAFLAALRLPESKKGGSSLKRVAPGSD